MVQKIFFRSTYIKKQEVGKTVKYLIIIVNIFIWLHTHLKWGTLENKVNLEILSSTSTFSETILCTLFACIFNIYSPRTEDAPLLYVSLR